MGLSSKRALQEFVERPLRYLSNHPTKLFRPGIVLLWRSDESAQKKKKAVWLKNLAKDCDLGCLDMEKFSEKFKLHHACNKLRQNGHVSTWELQKLTAAVLDTLSKLDKEKSGRILRTNSLNVALWEALVKDGFRTTHFIAEPSTLEGIKGVSLESGPPEAAANGEATDANANPEEVRIKSVINHAKSLGIPISAVPESAPDENVRRTILK